MDCVHAIYGKCVVIEFNKLIRKSLKILKDTHNISFQISKDARKKLSDIFVEEHSNLHQKPLPHNFKEKRKRIMSSDIDRLL